MMRKLFAVAVAVGLMGGVALAQKGPAKGGDGVQYKAKTVYDFDDDVVEGDLVRPEGEFLDSLKHGRKSSLIKIRETFIQEMLKSAEDL